MNNQVLAMSHYRKPLRIMFSGYFWRALVLIPSMSACFLLSLSDNVETLQKPEWCQCLPSPRHRPPFRCHAQHADDADVEPCWLQPGRTCATFNQIGEDSTEREYQYRVLMGKKNV